MGIHSANGDKPYDRLPVARGPILVSAAQLAILKLSIDPQTIVQRIVEIFGGIENRFRDRLKYRLLSYNACKKTNENQHEE